LIKRRTVANEACDNAHLSVNGRVAKASYQVKIGDEITITFGEKTLTVKVLSLNESIHKSEVTSMYEVIN